MVGAMEEERRGRKDTSDGKGASQVTGFPAV